MTHRTLVPVVLSLLALGACSTPRSLVASYPGTTTHAVSSHAAPSTSTQPAQSQDPFKGIDRRKGLQWYDGQALMQGFLGVSSYSNVEVGDSVDGDSGDLDELPVIGGGAQWKIGGRRLDWGLEGMLSFAGRGNVEAFAVGGGGAIVVVDVDLLVFELFGGPFVSLFLGEKMRLYGAAGPILQWASYDQTGGGLAEDGSGFGSGYYVRGGLEFILPSRTLVGFGGRWSDTSVDLGGPLGDLDIDGAQILFTVSRGL